MSQKSNHSEFVGEQLSSLRRERGLTREALAQKAGIIPAFLTAIEIGAVECSSALFVTLCLALDVRCAEISQLIVARECEDARLQRALDGALHPGRELLSAEQYRSMRLSYELRRKRFDWQRKKRALALKRARFVRTKILF